MTANPTTPAETVRAVAERLWPGYEWMISPYTVGTFIIFANGHDYRFRPDSLDSLRLCLERCSEGQRAMFDCCVYCPEDPIEGGFGGASFSPAMDPHAVLLAPLPDLWSALLLALDEAKA